MEFVLIGVKQEPGHGEINTDIGITNFIGCLTGNVVRRDANNNGRYSSAVRGSRNNILSRARARSRKVGGGYSCVELIIELLQASSNALVVWFL